MNATQYFLSFTILLNSLPLSAQQAVSPPANSNWQRVQALPIGTSLHLNAGKRHQSCKISTVDADTLTCTSGKNPVYSRTEITSIKLTRRGRSTLAGLGIGAGVGFVVGAATAGPRCTQQQFCILDFGRGTVGSIGAIMLGFVGAPIGYFTDFTRSTIYKMP
jgi:hypothetical protein